MNEKLLHIGTKSLRLLSASVLHSQGVPISGPFPNLFISAVGDGPRIFPN